MTKAIRIHETGGPEVLKWEDVEVGAPGRKEVRIRQTAVGLNYIDIYHRQGLYPINLPAILGTEGAGVVEAVGAGVTAFKPGDRVAYAGGQLGSYTEARVMPAEVLVPVPDGIDDKAAAAMMLKGMTSHMLLFKVHPVKKRETVLVHAAAGGVGLILVQWAKQRGCTVIGTVGSDEKADLIRRHGCDHAIVYTRENFAEKVKEITRGKGVSVIYDGVGKDTFEGSLDSLAPFGHMVSYGNASGPVPPIEPLKLSQKGSLTLTRPTLFTYTADPRVRRKAAKALFDVVLEGGVKIEVEQSYPLSETARAHADLAARRTTGSTVLVP